MLFIRFSSIKPILTAFQSNKRDSPSPLMFAYMSSFQHGFGNCWAKVPLATVEFVCIPIKILSTTSWRYAKPKAKYFKSISNRSLGFIVHCLKMSKVTPKICKFLGPQLDSQVKYRRVFKMNLCAQKLTDDPGENSKKKTHSWVLLLNVWPSKHADTRHQSVGAT